jgi:hypothetical protein
MLLLEFVELTPGSREGILDRDLGMCVPIIIRGRVADHDVVVGRQRQKDMNLKAYPVSMAVARTDDGYPARGNAMIVLFKPLEFTLDAFTHRIRRLAFLESDLKGYWQLSLLSMAPMRRHRGSPIHGSQDGCGLSRAFAVRKLAACRVTKATGSARKRAPGGVPTFSSRHCERSEAIQLWRRE